MKRKAQSILSADGQQALDQHAQVLHHLEDLSLVTMHNYLSDFRQFIAWCECSWHDGQEDRSFLSQVSLLTCYRNNLQTTLNLKPSAVNRTLISLKCYFVWTRKTHLTQSDPINPIKFVPKEAIPPRHLSYEDEDALVAAVNAAGVLWDQIFITLLLLTGLRAQELCSLTHQQLHLGRRQRTLLIVGKRKKVCEVPLNSTARLTLNQYLETFSLEGQYLFPSEKTYYALTSWARRYLVTKYATQTQVTDISPSWLTPSLWLSNRRSSSSALARPDHGV